jgi:hypothetical protein
MAEPFVPINDSDAEMFFGILEAHWRSGVADHVEVIKIDGDRILIDLKQSTNEQLPDIYIPIKKTEDNKELRAEAEAVVQHLSAFARQGKVPKALFERLRNCIDRSDRQLMMQSMFLKRQLRTFLLQHPPPAKK